MGLDFFGQFLLRRGVIHRRQLLETIAYQEQHNLKLGEQAVRAGLLTYDDCDRIRKAQRGRSGRFGEIAVELGLLTAAQIEHLTRRQRNNHLYLGEALVQLGHLTTAQLAAELDLFEATQSDYRSGADGTPSDDLPGDVALICQLTCDLLARLSGLPMKLGSPAAPAPAPPEALTASIELRGEQVFVFAVTLPERLAVRVCQGMLDLVDAPPRELVVNALLEVVNCAAGDACGRLAQLGRDATIAPTRRGAPAGRPDRLIPLHSPDADAAIRIYADGPSGRPVDSPLSSD